MGYLLHTYEPLILPCSMGEDLLVNFWRTWTFTWRKYIKIIFLIFFSYFKKSSFYVKLWQRTITFCELKPVKLNYKCFFFLFLLIHLVSCLFHKLLSYEEHASSVHSPKINIQRHLWRSKNILQNIAHNLNCRIINVINFFVGETQGKKLNMQVQIRRNI